MNGDARGIHKIAGTEVVEQNIGTRGYSALTRSLYEVRYLTTSYPFVPAANAGTGVTGTTNVFVRRKVAK